MRQQLSYKVNLTIAELARVVASTFESKIIARVPRENLDKILTKIQGLCLVGISSIDEGLSFAKLMILSKINKEAHD